MANRGGWNPTRLAAARRRLAMYGLRVICLSCDWRGRYFSETGELAEMRGTGWTPSFGSAKRLRELPCPRCASIALRSMYWVETHADLAAAARQTIRAIDRAVGRRDA